MKFDEIAAKMLNLFIEEDNLTSTYIAKFIFNPKNRDELLKKNNLIIGRLKTWVKRGIIINGTVENRTAHYNLNSKNIKMGQLLLSMEDGDVDELGEYLVIDIEGQDRIIFRLTEEC